MKNLLTGVLLLCGAVALGQKVKVTDGSLKSLKGEESVNLEFVYDGMTLGKGKSEEDYIKEKKAEYNAKEEGRGDKWEKAWYEDRGTRFEPQFRELFAKHAGLSTVNEQSKYTMIFKTTHTDTGWNVGVMRYPAFIDAEILIVETGNRDNVVAKITVLKSPGRDAWGFDFETGARLQEAYAKAGKEVGQLVSKQAR